MDSQITELENQLEAVKDFQMRQKEIEEETIALRQSNSKLQEELNQQKYNLERNFVDRTGQMKRDFEKQLHEQKRIAEEDIDSKMDDMVKRILDQNKQMSHELKLHIEVILNTISTCQGNTQYSMQPEFDICCK